MALSSEVETFSELVLLANDRRMVGEPVDVLADMVSNDLQVSW